MFLYSLFVFYMFVNVLVFMVGHLLLMLFFKSWRTGLQGQMKRGIVRQVLCDLVPYFQCKTIVYIERMEIS